MLENNPLVHIANAIGRGVTALFGSRNERLVRELLPTVEEINRLEPRFEKLSDAALAERTEDLKKTLRKALEDEGGLKLLVDANRLRLDARSQEADELAKKYRVVEQKCLDDILPEAFALVREAGKRTISQRHYDVQLIGGMVLHQGKISEMITGEGKTLVSTLPAFLNSLPGYGVHVVTVNDYLARRDRDWNAQLFNVLGVTVGVIQSDMGNAERKRAYACDITYGTNNEYGFDYLRDNMKIDKEAQVQKGLNYAIIDEVDSILVDEARTPLIISGDAVESTDAYYVADSIARKLRGTERNKLEEEAKKKGVEREDLEVDWDFVYSEKDHQLWMTERGIEHAEKMLGKGNIYEGANLQWPHFIEQALRAHNLYKRDVEYVVEPEDGRMAVVIVDEFTGRKMHGRSWSDGLHQACEAKEGLKIKEETQTLATVTLQNYFRLYKKLAGMTGTASTEASELLEIYKLDVTTIPTNRPLIRKNYQDVVYRTTKEKYKAVCAEIEAVHAMGRPILVGTVSIESSERLADMLQRRGIDHEVLNAKQHEREAQIVAKAGHLGHVTIATNMAGRGTDIILGTFTQQELLDHWKKAGAAPKDLELGDPQFYEKQAKFWRTRKLSSGATLISDDANNPGEWQWREVSLEFTHEGKKYEGVPLATRVQDLGGLHIIGTERHEARRIDNQLRGRCGRQGDPGSSRFYLSLEDDLMRKFAGDRVSWLLSKLGMEEGQEISARMVTNAIEKAQKKVEAYHFDVRKSLLEYDAVMDEQRKLVYGERQRILDGGNLRDAVFRWIDVTVEKALKQYVADDMKSNDRDPVGLCEWARQKFDLRVLPRELEGEKEDEIYELLMQRIRAAYEERAKMIGEDMPRIERFLLNQKIDEKWKDHLHGMDQLRSSIGYRGYAQLDPKVAYKEEGYQLFQEMWENVGGEISDLLFRIQPMKKEKVDEMNVPVMKPTTFVAQKPTEIEQTARQQAEKNERQAYQASKAGPDGAAAAAKPIEREEPKIGRNEKCHCGSGKKYKNCHGKQKSPK